MIHWALFRKNVADSMLLWTACGLCMFAFAWVFVLVNASWDMERFQAIVDLLPDAFDKLAPVPLDQLTSFDSRLSIFFEDPVTYVLIAAWCVSRASDTVSGQLSAGTMEMLLAQPISRLQAIATPSVVNLLGVVMLSICAWVGLFAGVQTSSVASSGGIQELLFSDATQEAASPEMTPLREIVNLRLLLPALSNFIGFGFFLCGMTTVLSAFDRYRWRTIGIASAFVLGSMVVEILAQSIDALSWLGTLSFFSLYEPVRFATDSVAAGSPQWLWSSGAPSDDSHRVLGVCACNSILVGLGALAFVVATVKFRRRDLPAPL